MKPKNFFAFLVAVLLVSSTMGFAQKKARSPEAGQAYNNGLNLAKKQKYEQAISKFKTAVTKDDSFPEAYYMMGYCYKKLRNYEKAKDAFRKAINLNKKFEIAYDALGNLLAAEGKDQEAIATFQAILAFNENSAKAHYGLGKIYFGQKNYQTAVEYLQKSVKANPKYSKAYNILGLSLEKLNRFDESIAAFKNAITNERRKSLKGDYYYRMGKVMVEAKKYDEGIKTLNQAIRLSRNAMVKAGANFYLGDAYKNLGQKQKALQYYEKAAKHRVWKQLAQYEINMIKNPDKYAY